MNKSIKDQIIQLGQDEKGPEENRSAQVIDLAFLWNKESLVSIQADRSSLLLGLVELSSALSRSMESLFFIKQIAGQASIGETLAKKIEDNRTAFDSLTHDIQVSTKRLHLLTELEESNKELYHEKEALETRISELIYLDSFDPGSLDDLKKQEQALLQVKPWLHDLQILKDKIEHELPQLELISGQAFDVLNEEYRQNLNKTQKNLHKIHDRAAEYHQEMQRMQAETKKIEAEITSKISQYEEMEKALNNKRAALDQYIKIDQEIAGAIQNQEAAKAQAMLSNIEDQLSKVDEALRQAILTNQKVKGLMDQS